MFKTCVKEVVGWGLRRCGGYIALRVFLRRRRAAILVYHDPRPEILGRHIAWLARWYRFISLDTLVGAIETGDWSAVPRGALVITFDDGHRGNAALADLWARQSVRPVIYLCSQIVGASRHFWWLELPDEAESLKKLDHDAFLKRLSEKAGYFPEKIYDDRQALSADELRSLDALVTWGGHTRSHPILTRCSDVAAQEEIGESRRELESMLGHSVEHFAYPNGDYGVREIALLKEAGYRSARTIRPGWNGPGADPFQLRAFSIEDDASLNVLALRLSGALVPALALKRWARRWCRRGRAS